MRKTSLMLLTVVGVLCLVVMPALAEIAASDSVDGAYNKTTLRIAGETLAITYGGSGTNSSGGIKVYDFPVGRLVVHGVVVDNFKFTPSYTATGLATNDGGDFSFGTATASGSDLTGTEVDLCPKTSLDPFIASADGGDATGYLTAATIASDTAAVGTALTEDTGAVGTAVTMDTYITNGIPMVTNVYLTTSTIVTNADLTTATIATNWTITTTAGSSALANAVQLDGTTTAKDLYANLLVDADDITGSATGTVSALVHILWSNIGDD